MTVYSNLTPWPVHTNLNLLPSDGHAFVANGHVFGLPPSEKGVVFIVSQEVRLAVPDRRDLVIAMFICDSLGHHITEDGNPYWVTIGLVGEIW